MRKSWHEKLHNSKELACIETIDEGMSKRCGEGYTARKKRAKLIVEEYERSIMRF